jgi:hypothetical protein
MLSRDTGPIDNVDVLVFCGVALLFFLFWFLGRIDNRKHPKRFETLASELGVTVTQIHDFDSRFEFVARGRSFSARYSRVSRSTGSSTSSIWKLVVSTPLSKRWELHDLQVRALGRLGGWLVNALRRNRTAAVPTRGDAVTARVSASANVSDDFETRFSVRDQGTLPPNWMTSAVRQAICAIYDDVEIKVLTSHTTLEACEGRLSFIADEPDKMKAESFRRLLAHLGTLADALVSAAQNADRFQCSVK